VVVVGERECVQPPTLPILLTNPTTATQQHPSDPPMCRVDELLLKEQARWCSRGVVVVVVVVGGVVSGGDKRENDAEASNKESIRKAMPACMVW
jgi:hypothetical protein